MPISAEIAMFRPKQVYICRNKTISAEYSVSAEFRFFEMGCFGFRCFGKKSVSVGHYSVRTFIKQRFAIYKCQMTAALRRAVGYVICGRAQTA